MYASAKVYIGGSPTLCMGITEQYGKGKERLLEDPAVCKENREIFRAFFEEEEYKLRRINGLQSLDEAAYKTLLTYVNRLKLMNKFFANKPWANLSREDIQKVFDDLEDGRITAKHGRRYSDRDCFYQIMRGKPFELAGQSKVATEVLRYCRGRDPSEVRFIDEMAVRKLVEVAIKPEHRLLIWLAFDIGENIGTLVRLQRKDFLRQENSDTGESEYAVNLPRNKLKRSRTTRTELTNFAETAQYLDIILAGKLEHDCLFRFQVRQANRFLTRAAKITQARCRPAGQMVTWKDLRSSMACHLLNKGWTMDEIKARLGHTPSSRVLDKYVSYLAVNRKAAKSKFHGSTVSSLKANLEEKDDRLKLVVMRDAELRAQLAELQEFKRMVEGKLDAISLRVIRQRTKASS